MLFFKLREAVLSQNTAILKLAHLCHRLKPVPVSPVYLLTIKLK